MVGESYQNQINHLLEPIPMTIALPLLLLLKNLCKRDYTLTPLSEENQRFMLDRLLKMMGAQGSYEEELVKSAADQANKHFDHYFYGNVLSSFIMDKEMQSDEKFRPVVERALCKALDEPYCSGEYLSGDDSRPQEVLYSLHPDGTLAVEIKHSQRGDPGPMMRKSFGSFALSSLGLHPLPYKIDVLLLSEIQSDPLLRSALAAVKGHCPDRRSDERQFLAFRHPAMESPFLLDIRYAYADVDDTGEGAVLCSAYFSEDDVRTSKSQEILKSSLADVNTIAVDYTTNGREFIYLPEFATQYTDDPVYGDNANEGFLPIPQAMIGLESHGLCLHNPLRSECGRFLVGPNSNYGLADDLVDFHLEVNRHALSLATDLIKKGSSLDQIKKDCGEYLEWAIENADKMDRPGLLEDLGLKVANASATPDQPSM
jgi:hypothetical protein